MEAFIWFYHLAIPLFGWWILTNEFRKWSEVRNQKADWGTDFKKDFLKSVVFSLLHFLPEIHMKAARDTALTNRVRLLWLGLRSLSFGLAFILLFAVWNLIPTPVILLVSLVVFLLFRWIKSLSTAAHILMGLSIFIGGFENLLGASSNLMRAAEDAPWIFSLSSNYFQGALLGFGIGFVLRLVFRISGVAWWSGLNLLLAGIVSLGGAWGFFLGDFLGGALEDWFLYSEKSFRWKSGISAAMGLLMLVLSAPYQWMVMNWLNGQYSVELRSMQLALMMALFLFVECVISMGFFHFYHVREKAD